MPTLETPMRDLQISVPVTIFEEIESLAREEQRTPSEVVEAAVRYYQFVQQWQTIRTWGDATRTHLKVSEEGDALETYLG